MSGRYPEEIYNGRITAYERKWFFFDVKKAKDGTRRLVITESHGPKSTRERTSITVAEGDLADFLRGLLSAMEAMGFEQKSSPPKVPSPSPRTTSREFARAGEPWTPEEDEKLRSEVEKGFYISDIAHYHQRRPSAIRSRIEKLAATRQNP